MVATAKRKPASKIGMDEAGENVNPAASKVKVKPVQYVPRHPTPAECIGTSLHACQGAGCTAKWDARRLNEIVDGESVATDHRTFFHVQLIEMPVYSSYIDPWTDKLTLDIWCPVHGGVLPIVTRRWLCPACYEAEWNADVALWCQDQRNIDYGPTLDDVMDEAIARGELPEECELLPEEPIQLAKFINIYTRSAVEGRG